MEFFLNLCDYISAYCELNIESESKNKKVEQITYTNQVNTNDNICVLCGMTYPKLYAHCCKCQISWQFMDKHCCHCKNTFFLHKKKIHICENSKNK